MAVLYRRAAVKKVQWFESLWRQGACSSKHRLFVFVVIVVVVVVVLALLS